MSAAFDPYRKWLGIPDGPRPPSHYQLLAIAQQETDAEVIHAAVIRQSAYVRNFQTGPYSDQATQLLGEIAAAKACLSDPQRRSAYDVELLRTFPTLAPPVPANAPPLPPPMSAAVPAPAVYAYPAASPPEAWGAPPQPYGQPGAWGVPQQAVWRQPYDYRPATSRPIPVWVWAAGAMGSCLVIALVVALVLVLRNTDRTVATQSSTPPETAVDMQIGGSGQPAAGALPSVAGGEAAPPADEASSLSNVASGAPVGGGPPPSPTGSAPAAAVPGGGYSLPPPRTAANTTFDDSQVRLQRFPDLGWGLKSLAFSPDSNLVAAGKQDSAIMLFDLARGTRLALVEDLEILGQVTSCAFSANGEKLIAGGNSGAILVWDVDVANGLRQAGQFSGHVKEITCQSVSPAGGFVLSGSKDKSLRYWDLSTRREAHSWRDFQHELLACQVLPGGAAATATDGTVVLVVDLSTGATLRTITLGGRARLAAISPDGRYFAREDTYNVELWDLELGALVASFEGNETPWALAFSPDGNYFVSGGRGKLNVWNMATHQRILAIDTGVIFYHYPLAISPNSRSIAVYPQAAGQELVVAHLPPPR